MGKQREDAETKNKRLTDEVNEIQESLRGGSNAKQDLLDKINKLEEIKAGLQKEINLFNTRVNAEMENIENLEQGLQKVEANQSGLAKTMRECEARLAQVQDEKQDKDAQIKQMKEEIAHQEDLV